MLLSLKKSIKIVVFVVGIGAVSAYSGICDATNIKPQKNDSITSEIKGNEYIVYYSSGEVKERTELKNKVPHGKHIRYYQGGKTKSKGSCVNGKQEGLSTWYYEKSGYTQAVLENANIGYYESGGIMRKVNYKSGKKEGLYTWYDKSGDIYRIACYQDGLEINVGQKKHRENPETFICP